MIKGRFPHERKAAFLIITGILFAYFKDFDEYCIYSTDFLILLMSLNNIV